jgi:hypothetical protein
MKVKAKNKIEALEQYGIERIYFKGSKPYGCIWSIYIYHVYAIRVSYGLYEIVMTRVN